MERIIRTYPPSAQQVCIAMYIRRQAKHIDTKYDTADMPMLQVVVSMGTVQPAVA